MNHRITQLAAENNAIWCDTVCRAHGIPGEFHPGLWLNRKPTPKYYPNVVTLAGSELQAEQLKQIREMLEYGLPLGWAVKDSFCSADLSDWGFKVLFEVSWLCLDPSKIVPPRSQSEMQWQRITDPLDLQKWEAAWAGHQPGYPVEPAVFKPGLLAEPDVAFFAAYRDQEILAGGIANRSGEVVGLTNIFTPVDEGIPVWTACIHLIREIYPFLPVVGYEGGTDIHTPISLGFEITGSLQVWTKQ